jgi:hypothetical protein
VGHPHPGIEYVAESVLELGPLVGNGEEVSPNCTRQFTSRIYKLQVIDDGISQYEDNVRKISELHARSLSAVGDLSQHESVELGGLAAENRDMGNTLMRRIGSLGFLMAKAAGKKFQKAIENYMNVEQDHRKKNRQRIEDQFKIGASCFLGSCHLTIRSRSQTQCHAGGNFRCRPSRRL